MKKLSLVLLVVVLAGLTPSHAETWRVSQAGRADFCSIQEAIMDASVQSDDIILVDPGVYEELVRIPASKRLTVRSTQGFEATIIRRPGEPEKGPKMTVLIQSGSTFDGFTVDNPQGVQQPLTTLDQIPTKDNLLENTAGITVTGPARVQNCKVSGHRYGFLQECPSGALGMAPSMRYNISVDNDIGICCCETYSEVRDNVVMNNDWVGIISAHSSCDDIINNLVVGNGTAGREFSCGILFWQSYDWRPYELNPRISVSTISDNIGDGLVCIWEKGAPNQPVIENSIISNNSGSGVRVVPASDEINTPRPRIYKCNLWGNGEAATVNVHRIIDSISADPMFVEGYLLHESSPCVNRGCIPDNKGSTRIDGTADHLNTDLGFHYPVSLGIQAH